MKLRCLTLKICCFGKLKERKSKMKVKLRLFKFVRICKDLNALNFISFVGKRGRMNVRDFG